METTTEIKLVTKPKIVHKLEEIGANVTKRLEDLNIQNLVATEDTMKSLKELRADLNKEFATFEDQRKFIKGEILNPFNEFEAVYKAEISLKYEGAISLLKDKIGTVELKIKDAKRSNIKLFYDELCQAEGIDFVPFEKVGLDINLSVTEKALRDKCNEYIAKVIDDVKLIKASDFEAETMAEYKVSLNVSQAITTVKERKEREKNERIRLHQIEVNRRIAKLRSIGMIPDDFSKSFVYDLENFMTKQFVEESSNDEFNTKFIEYEEKIKVIELSKKTPSGSQPQMQFTASLAQTISSPVVKETIKEEVVTASFEVTGTMSQIQALGQYMKSINITYKNI